MWALCWSSLHGPCFCRQAGRFPDRWCLLPTFAAFRSRPKREFFLRCSARSTLHTKRGFVGGYEASRSLTIGSSDRGCRLRWAKEGIDDWDKASSFDLAHPRRSTSSLGAGTTMERTKGIEVLIWLLGPLCAAALVAPLDQFFAYN